ncbi:TIGR01777 family oxidoreductase [Vicingaceae bacterium]|nr:TIGR01777 family oxidoreductase [Vicingaceae bacterium]
MEKKVLLGGGSGLVGKRLNQLLTAKGYDVWILSRSSKGKKNTIEWDVKNQQLDSSAIADFNHIINLTGAGIVDEPWTDERKKEIIDSRVKSTELLSKSISQNSNKPVSFVSASAVGYYGFVTGESFFKETDEAGTDFLAETCKLWEQSTDSIKKLDIPIALVRIGIVLDKNGGALKEMAKPVKLFAGAALGTGKQYLPWIHIEDLCRMFIHAMENKLEGPFNAGAPNQVNNKTFTKVLAKVLNRPFFLPNVPAFVMKLLLGTRALLVLEGSRVSPEKIEQTGFKFEFTKLEEALREIYG